MQEPNVSGQPDAFDLTVDRVQTGVIAVQFALRQFSFSPLQHVVNAFRHGEELRFLGNDHGPLGVDTQSVAQWDQGVEKLRHTASVGGAVHVRNAQSGKSFRQFRKSARRLRRHEAQVATGVRFGISNYVNQCDEPREVGILRASVAEYDSASSSHGTDLRLC